MSRPTTTPGSSSAILLCAVCSAIGIVAAAGRALYEIGKAWDHGVGKSELKERDEHRRLAGVTYPRFLLDDLAHHAPAARRLAIDLAPAVEGGA